MRRLAINDYEEAQGVFEKINAHPRGVDSGHTRAEIEAFSVDPYDVALRSGEMREIRTLKLPYILDNDDVGVMTETGLDVTAIHVDNQVAIHVVDGIYEEEAALLSTKIAKIPDEMNQGEAAGMVTLGIAAYNPIDHLTGVQPTDTVVILGTSGVVGSSLIQPPHGKGIRVLTSASSKNEEKVRRLGVSVSAAYGKINLDMQFADQADPVIGTTKGSIKGETGIQILKPGERYVVLNDFLDLNPRQKKEGFYKSSAPKKKYQDAEALADIIKSYRKDAFHIFISMNLPVSFIYVIQAYQQVKGYPPAGKIILSSEK